MQRKHRRTLERLFESPTRATIKWDDIESLIVALGGQTEEGRGSRVRFYLNEVVATFHRPHPSKEANKPTVMDIRRFLIEAGVER